MRIFFLTFSTGRGRNSNLWDIFFRRLFLGDFRLRDSVRLFCFDSDQFSCIPRPEIPVLIISTFQADFGLKEDPDADLEQIFQFGKSR